MEEETAKWEAGADADGDVNMEAPEEAAEEAPAAEPEATEAVPEATNEAEEEAAPAEEADESTAPADNQEEAAEQTTEPAEEGEKEEVDGDAEMADAKGADEEPEAPAEKKEEVPAVEDKRMEVIDNMEKIEKEFSDLKEKLYQDQIQWLKEDMAEIKRGTDEQFTEHCKELEAERQEKLWKAEQWKQHILLSIENMYQAEVKQAADEFEAEKRHLRNRMISALQTQMGKLEDEKNTITLVAEGSAAESRSSARLSRKKTKDQSIKEFTHKKTQPSHINFALRDSEVYEDLNYMSKSHPSDPNFELERWLELAPLL